MDWYDGIFAISFIVSGILAFMYNNSLMGYIASKYPEKYKEIYGDCIALWAKKRFLEFTWGKENFDDKKIEQLKQKGRVWVCICISVFVIGVTISLGFGIFTAISKGN